MRRQTIMHLMLFLTILVLSAGCSPLILPPDADTVVRETQEVEPFTAVNICCGMHLELTQGESRSVELAGDQAILKEIDVTVRNNELIVQFRQRFNFGFHLNNRLVTVYVTTPALDALELSGGSQGKSAEFRATDLQLTLSGGSQLTLEELNATTLTSNLSGGAQLTIRTGAVETQNVDASGGSRYITEEVSSEDATLDFSGGSSARIRVATALRVDASGGSDVAYHGSPAVDQNISGGSRVRSLGE